jgi:hypothetical protein
MNARLIFPVIGTTYECALIESFKIEGYEEVITASNVEAFARAFDEGFANAGDCDLVILIDSQSECMNTLLEKLPQLTFSIKVIVFSSILSWCGVASRHTVDDPCAEFLSRTPINSVLDVASVESRFWRMAETDRNGSRIYFIGTGLFYGHSGYDFEFMLRSYWKASLESENQRMMLPFCSTPVGTGNILATHMDDFTNFIVHLVKDNDHQSPSFFAAVDNSSRGIDTPDMLNCALFRKTNGGTVPTETGSYDEFSLTPERKSTSVYKPFLMEANIVYSSTYHDLPFGPKEPRFFEGIWRQFLYHHKLSPCRVVIAGAPCTGKTGAAKLISFRFSF